MAEVVAVRRGAIILCGGASSRMGRDKAWLSFGPHEVMLQRVVRLVGEVVPVENIVCVAAPSQELPELPRGVRTIYDPVPHCGPLAGLATGLRSLADQVDAVFVAGCDVPLLVPAFVRRMFELLGDHEAVVAEDEDWCHPLSAVYRTSVLQQADQLLAEGERSLMSLVERCDARKMPIELLRDGDPELSSLIGCNTLDDYKRALGAAGISVS
jgi:molybdopterin-guanine dinucleotide biosynthesis protein A